MARQARGTDKRALLPPKLGQWRNCPPLPIWERPIVNSNRHLSLPFVLHGSLQIRTDRPNHTLKVGNGYHRQSAPNPLLCHAEPTTQPLLPPIATMSSYPRLAAAVEPVHVELGRSSESSSSCSSTITAPPAAYYAARLQAQDDQLAAFFGTKKPHTSRVVAPPSYASESDIKLPTYDAALAEPKTLARAMFLYGFRASSSFSNRVPI